MITQPWISWFFVDAPTSLGTNEHLVSSMQTFETSLYLLALRRYPHALTACASALESGIQAATHVGATNDDRFIDLFDKARMHSPLLAAFPESRFTRFRRARNEITHRGFSPKDDNRSVSLFVRVGVPLLRICYRDFHNFDLDASLRPEYARFMGIAQDIVKKAEPLNVDLTYALNPLGHRILWHLNNLHRAEWVSEAMGDVPPGVQFDREQKYKERFEMSFDISWEVDCPICGGSCTAICEIDSRAFRDLQIRPVRLACAECEFIVHDSHHFLSELLVGAQLEACRDQILKEYGTLKPGSDRKGRKEPAVQRGEEE